MHSVNSTTPTVYPRNDKLLPENILICVTFFFVEKRLRFLKEISSYFSQLGETVSVYIITNTDDLAERKKIEEAIKGKGFVYQIVCPTLLGHPWLLVWSHFAVFKSHFQDETITHFLYLEDDICVKPNNIAYWIKGRESLRAFNLIPSFLRFEQKDGEDGAYSSDVTQVVNISSIPRVNISNSYAYLNLPQPYQGMYLLDRDLMLEHLTGPSSNPESGKKWDIRADAAQGITFLNVPKGFLSRNLIGYKVLKNRIDPDCLIHHTPNNYANDPTQIFGKILISELISIWKPFIPSRIRDCLKDWLPPVAIRGIQVLRDALKATRTTITR